MTSYQLAIIIVFFSFLTITLSTHAQTAGVDVWIDEVEIGSGGIGELTISITADNGATIGAIQTEVAYDSDAIDVISCTFDAFFGVCDTSTSGLIKLAAIQTTGVQNSELATITVKASGEEGDVISFIPTTGLIGDVSGAQLVEYDDVQGNVTIEALSPTSIALSDSNVASNPSFIISAAILMLAIMLIFVFYRTQTHR